MSKSTIEKAEEKKKKREHVKSLLYPTGPAERTNRS